MALWTVVFLGSCSLFLRSVRGAELQEGGCCRWSTCWTGQPASDTSSEVLLAPQLWALHFIPALWVTSASPSASPPTEGSINLRQIKSECWKVYNKYMGFICCFSVPLSPTVSRLQGAVSWVLKATLLLI